MAWTAPRTYTTGEIITAAILNEHVRDNLLETAPAKAAAAGDLFYASGANAVAKLAKGTARQVLQTNAGLTAPEWADSPQSLLTAQGDMLYASAANTLARLARGAAEYTLRVNAAGTDIEWSAKSIYTGTDVGKGAAGTAERVYIATDTFIIYYDNGIAWVEIGRAAGQIGAGDLGFDPATQTELNTHSTTNPIDHPAGSVGDAAMGNRTADPTIATAYALEGTVTQHLSWLTKNIKALKGVAGNWYDAASATIEGLWAKFDASTGHKHTGAAGDAPAVMATGSWQDTTTSIAASSTYTKTIALGRAATSGRLIARRNTASSSLMYDGAIVFFGTATADAVSWQQFYDSVPNIINKFYAGADLRGETSANASSHQFGAQIHIKSVRITGTDLEIIFQNQNNTDARTLEVDLRWEVA